MYLLITVLFIIDGTSILKSIFVFLLMLVSECHPVFTCALSQVRAYLVPGAIVSRPRCDYLVPCALTSLSRCRSSFGCLKWIFFYNVNEKAWAGKGFVEILNKIMICYLMLHVGIKRE